MLIFQNCEFSEDFLKKKMPEAKDNEQIQSRYSNTFSDWLKNLKGFQIKGCIKISRVTLKKLTGGCKSWKNSKKLKKTHLN